MGELLMAPTKLLRGEDFIKALQKTGLLPDRCITVEIRASVGDPITLDYSVHADESLLGAAEGIQETDDPSEAVAR